MRKVHHHAKKVALTAHSEIEGIIEGMSFREAFCIACAIAVIAGIALIVEHETHLNGDIVFSSAAAIGAHPLNVCFRRIVSLVFG
jgi:hypothetical protein